LSASTDALVAVSSFKAIEVSHGTTLVQETENFVEVSGSEIIVRTPGTSFNVVYEKTDDNQLMANSFSARKGQDEARRISFPQFLTLAWTAANEKAKEIGWMA
jgi:hypothetical protein